MNSRIIRCICAAALVGLSAPAYADIYRYLPDQQSSALRNAVETGAPIGTYDKAFLAWTAYILVQPDCGVAESVRHARQMTQIIETSLSAANFEDPFAQMKAQADIKKVWSSEACKKQDGADLLEAIIEVLQIENNR